MKKIITSLLLFMTTICGYSQCSETAIGVSTSSVTLVQLYHPGFFLIPSGFDNVVDWIVTDDSGTIIHQETTSGPWADQSFITFTHSVPTTDIMNVSVTITNTTSGIVCNIEDILVWGGEIINWEPLNSNGGALPIELLAFTGGVKENKISLSWETAIEENNLGFDIQKSSNSKHWETIGFVKGQGNSSQLNSYRRDDDSPHNGINYYRLKQIDLDGQFTYSNIVAVEYRKSNSNLIVFPNPSSGHIKIDISNIKRQNIDLRIVDTQGRLVWRTNIIEKNWSGNVRLESNGLYFITTKTGNEIRREKIFVQR